MGWTDDLEQNERMEKEMYEGDDIHGDTVVKCGRKWCKFNESGECGLAEIELGKTGLCMTGEPEMDNPSGWNPKDTG